MPLHSHWVILCQSKGLQGHYSAASAQTYNHVMPIGLSCNPTTHTLHNTCQTSHVLQLRKALEAVYSQDGAVLPQKARFFRGQMTTIMSRALTELGIKPLPSRRCFSVMSMLEDRLESVYKQDPRYNDKATSMFNIDLGPPEVMLTDKCCIKNIGSRFGRVPAQL